METVTIPVEWLEGVVEMNNNERDKMTQLGFIQTAEYYDGRAKAYQFILDNYRQ